MLSYLLLSIFFPSSLLLATFPSLLPTLHYARLIILLLLLLPSSHFLDFSFLIFLLPLPLSVFSPFFFLSFTLYFLPPLPLSIYSPSSLHIASFPSFLPTLHNSRLIFLSLLLPPSSHFLPPSSSPHLPGLRLLSEAPGSSIESTGYLSCKHRAKLIPSRSAYEYDEEHAVEPHLKGRQNESSEQLIIHSFNSVSDLSSITFAHSSSRIPILCVFEIYPDVSMPFTIFSIRFNSYFKR